MVTQLRWLSPDWKQKITHSGDIIWLSDNHPFYVVARTEHAVYKTFSESL